MCLLCVCVYGEVPRAEQANKEAPKSIKTTAQDAQTTCGHDMKPPMKCSTTYTTKILYIYYVCVCVQSSYIVCFKRFGLMSSWIIEAISHGKLRIRMCPSISMYIEVQRHLHQAEGTFLIAHTHKINTSTSSRLGCYIWQIIVDVRQ